MIDHLAPIGLSVYSRLTHLQKTVESLKNNSLAPRSELYIFSDAPRPGDEKRVEDVRAYLKSIDGFKALHIVERESNDRVANSRGGLRMLLDQFGKVVFLAEDIVTAPGFLTFMNEALEKYQGNQKIFNISGYSPPIKIPANYRCDIFTLRRMSAWGFGIWKDRFDFIRYMSTEEYENFAEDRKKVRSFVRAGGKDLMTMLKSDAYGEIDAGDVKLMYAQFLSDQYTVYPTRSLVQNIGHDGSGVHCDETDKFRVTLSDRTTFRFPDAPAADRRIVTANRKFRNRNKHDNWKAKMVGEAKGLVKRILNL